jgi:hypothetical protein
MNGKKLLSGDSKSSQSGKEFKVVMTAFRKNKTIVF